MRRAGVLLHPTALPGPWGAGDLGPAARRFAAWLGEAGVAEWQVLPLTPSDDTGSPYASPSAFAGDPLLLSIDDLIEDGWLRAGDVEVGGARLAPSPRIDQAALRRAKTHALRLAARRVVEGRVDLTPIASRPGIGAWARFSAAKRIDSRGWWEWPADLDPDPSEALALEWLFDRQWSRLRSVCADAGVALFGDLPIFVALDSADVLAHRELFLLGPSGRPEVVAGVPPDAFTEKGQLWGMPLYDWSTHAEQGFRWWIDRVDALLARVDRVRIDHFRGFAAAWHVPAGDRDATGGAWVPGPGAALFEALRARFPALPIVAEDLGVITDDVVALRDGFGLPGMRILQFAFGGDPAHPYLPANHVENCVVYTGTHDNDTACGWWRAIGDDERSRVEAVLGREVREPGWDLIELAARSVASLAMFPAQDVLGLGSDARMNVPGTVVGNWGFRLADLPGPTIARRLRSLLIESGRCR